MEKVLRDKNSEFADGGFQDQCKIPVEKKYQYKPIYIPNEKGNDAKKGW